MRYQGWELEAVVSWFLVEIQTRPSVAEGESPNCWLVVSLENELLCNSKWTVFYVTKSPLPKVVMVERFAGSVSSNAKDCLDKESKQPVAVYGVVEGGGWKSHSRQLMLPALSAEKDPGSYHCPQSTRSFDFTTESADQDQTEWQYPLTVPRLVASVHALPAGHMHLHTFPIPWFMKAWTMCLQGSHVPLSCISQEHTHHHILCSWCRLGWEDKRPGKGWASHKHTGVFFSFKVQDWLLPRQELAHPAVKGRGSARTWGRGVERETKRDNR